MDVHQSRCSILKDFPELIVSRLRVRLAHQKSERLRRSTKLGVLPSAKPGRGKMLSTASASLTTEDGSGISVRSNAPRSQQNCDLHAALRHKLKTVSRSLCF